MLAWWVGGGDATGVSQPGTWLMQAYTLQWVGLL